MSKFSNLMIEEQHASNQAAAADMEYHRALANDKPLSYQHFSGVWAERAAQDDHADELERQMAYRNAYENKGMADM